MNRWFGEARESKTALVATFALALIVPSCGPSQPARTSDTFAASGPVLHRFPTLNGSSVGTENLAGRWSVILFLTTYDTVSQAIARRLEELRHQYRPRINVLAVVLEPPQNAPLVSVYVDTLSLGYPVALADQETLDGSGPFGDVRAVPSLVLLDRESRIVFKGSGAAALGEIEAQLSDAGVERR